MRETCLVGGSLFRFAGFLPVAVAGMCLVVPLAQATTLTTLATFDYYTNGATPYGNLVADASGNLYGTTSTGGTYQGGTVYKILAGTGGFSTVANFTGSASGDPLAGLIVDTGGNLYGTTYYGGTNNRGVVFKLAAGTSTITTLASFNSSTLSYPAAGLTADSNGNLYGTTTSGGSKNGGTVYELASGSSTLTPLVTFTGPNGSHPYAGLIADASGNLYGTTVDGGASGVGTVFKLSTNTSTLTTLATFNNTNGANPRAGLIADANGNLYGTTLQGGVNNQGTVFKLAAGTGTITTLANFDGDNGYYPIAGLIADANGNLFGTTTYGGVSGDGTVFELASGTNTITTLVTFDGTNGTNPQSGLFADANGNLYGTTTGDGSNSYGTVFELTNTNFAVPEPNSIALLAGAGLLLARRRRQIH